MKSYIVVFLCFFSHAALAQTGSDQSSSTQTDTTQPASDQQSGGTKAGSAQGDSNPVDANQTAIKVKPGAQAIKDKDLWEKTGYLHPFRRMPGYILQDQKAIWTSPVHTAKSDIKWWVVFGAATGALIATDKYTERQFPNTRTQVNLGNYTSNLGTGYTLIPISAAVYLLGTAKSDERFRETGLLCFETLIDTTLLEVIIKSATDRARPLEGNGNGEFYNGAHGLINSGFPSGHSIDTFGLASVFAHEYKHVWWVKLLAYTYAGTVVGARLAARKHFPSDVVAGGAMGWFVGDYVYAKRHNPDLEQKSTAMQKILAHVRIGGMEY